MVWACDMKHDVCVLGRRATGIEVQGKRGGRLKRRWLDNARAGLGENVLFGEEVYDRLAWRLDRK